MKCPHCGVRVLISHYGLKILKCPVCKKPLITKKEILSSEESIIVQKGTDKTAVKRTRNCLKPLFEEKSVKQP